MKTMIHSFMVIAICFIGFTSVNAQNYLLDYGPGSIAWSYQMMQQENAIRAQNAMMQARILNYYQQQAAASTYHMMNNPYQPMQGVMTYDGVYVNPQTTNNYHKEQVDCEHCDGGYNYRTIYMGGGESRQVKSRCNFCHGRGTVTRTVKNE